MNDTLLIWSYLGYAVVAIPLVVWLARTLFAHGATFPADVFDDRDELAEAVNRLLVIGFYLLNLGYALLLLTSNAGVASGLEAVELLITKLGVLLVSLGAIHFLNMLVFWRIRRRAEDRQPLPIAATVVGTTPPPAPAQP